jgi:two-component system sensor histidine kinase DegS
LSNDEEINLFRIVQECCNNMVKHSGATAAGLSLKQTHGRLEFALGDNGRGMGIRTEQTQEILGRGFGLSGMKERARTFGWSLDIQSQPGRGTTVLLAIPLRKIGDRL